MSQLPELNVTQVFSGQRLVFVGATGFVGKVTLSMLLARYGQVLDKVYVVVRKGSAASAERRFFDKVATSEPFQPLRDSLGEAGALEFLRNKCEILDGDLTDPLMGLSEAQAEELTGRVGAIINCAGLVSFNPSLEVGLNVNTHGVKNAVDLALKWAVPLVHMSTAFVAGNRSGLVFEDEEVLGYFPKKDELDGRDFSLEQELKDAEKIVARLREQADDKALTSTFRKKALERLAEEGRDAKDDKTLRLAVGRERKLWLTGELVRAGMERALHWGWPNTYTYTKSLGEQVMAATPGLRYSIVRPSIVETARTFPFPGWNEGFTTSAPVAFAGIKGHRAIPAGETTILDIIPVDQVAGATLGITAHAMRVHERRVYHLASGDVNPFYASRSVELVGLYRRRFYRRKETGNSLLNHLRSRVEPVPVTRKAFELMSAPAFIKGAQLLKSAIEEVRPAWGAPSVQALLDRAHNTLRDVEQQAQSLNGLVELFLPFLWENRYVFRCDNTRSVYERMAHEDRLKIGWAPEEVDWREYFLETHLPGLEKWVFPGLEEETRKRTAIPAHRDLLEMLEATVHAWRHRVAFRMVGDEREERFTYGEVHRYSARVGSFLMRAGIKPGERVLLLSENRPQWGISYFGILRAGATVVPVDPALTEAELVNIARRAEARACLLSDQASADFPGLEAALAQVGTRTYGMAHALDGDPDYPDRIGPVKKTAAADDVASLIFTSGTTGSPKGVMLTHRNFASLIAKLAGAFNVGVGDGLLSVLPLHHTFEFSAGFLTPFSRGAEISYIDELTSDRLGDVFETGRVTAMIGVPALWQLLHRKMTQEMASRPPLVEQALKALMAGHAELRNRTDVNLGKLLFWPVHRKFGGRIKVLVSGGSALPDDVHKAFHALGFNITEGYGLTEAAPVLSVAEASNKRLPGSVGKPLPGIELRIDSPDNDGIGEVLAKGPNVMAGYFGDREATEAVLQQGWLHTGDLGRLDAEGRLYLVGRKKDVIIDANGKNVYPDELEEEYGVHPHLKELSVVGLPEEGGGERVACLCVPDYKDRPREEVRRELEEHFRKVSADMPFYRRVKVLRFWDGELPRTSTRKVKRKKVVEELQRLERMAHSGDKARERVTQGTGGVAGWLYPLIAEVVNRPLSDVRPEARLSGDLGFDSLMLTELSVALEQAGVPLPAVEDLTHVQTVEDLRKLVASTSRRPSAETLARDISRDNARAEEVEIPVPDVVADLGRQLLSFSQRVLYGGVFDVKVTGRPFVPQNRNFLVVANHASHLDAGLIRTVLSAQGHKLVALAARDYFFDTPLKRAYFENFTDLIPMDRHGSLRESLRLAGEALRQGYNLLIFPEGTRSTSGELLEFKPTLGYLALTYEVDVLPLYLRGTYEALPKGSMFPKTKELGVHIGPALELADMRAKTRGMARSESYRYVTRLAEDSVKALRGGRVLNLDAAATPEEQRRALGSSGGQDS